MVKLKDHKPLAYHNSPQFRSKRFLARVWEAEPPVMPPCQNYEPWVDDNARRSSYTYVMQKDEEVFRFLCYNFLKLEYNRRLKDPECRSKLRRVREALAAVRHLEEYLMRVNMPLVYSQVFRNMKRLGMNDWDSAVSDCSMGLQRAVNGYNVALGFKFSTYAVRIILNVLTNLQRRQIKAANKIAYADLPDIFSEESEDFGPVVDNAQQELVEMLLHTLKENTAGLTEVERRVLRERFGLFGDERRTLELIGNDMGVSKERVRQIEAKGLEKLRVVFQTV